MKRSLALLATLSIIAACAPVTPEGGDTGPLKIGFIGPLTGDAASYGSDTINGMRIAVAEINAAGGVNGAQIEIIPEDGRCNGADAASAAQKLTSVDKVAAIIGGQCSGETLAAAPILEAAKIPLISPVSSSPDVTDAGTFVFRVYPSDALKTKVMKNVFDEKGYANVAILSENTDYATGLRDALVSDVGSDNVTFNETTEPGTKDFRTILTRLQDVEFDVFVPNGQTDAFIGAAMQQYRDLGFEQPAFSQDVADSKTLGEIAGEAVEGMELINTSSELGEGGTDSFANRFRATYGEPQSNLSFATLSYDATRLLAKVIGEVGRDGTAVRDALLAMPSYKGAAGSFHFDENGDVVGIGYALKRFENGVPVEVSKVEAE
ncbi:MAG: ABC transporter substrate-binding protein [Patescibacteria group bacterium]